MHNTEQTQVPDQDLSVQSQSDQGIEGQVDNQEITPPSEEPASSGEPASTKPIDYEKAYRNLEKEFTKRSQKLKQLEGWEKFQQETGITAEQALQQLEIYKQQIQASSAPTGAQAQPYYNPPAPASSFDDPRISHLEQQIRELHRERQLQELRAKFPQFDEYYAEVMDLADSQGLDLETAFGKVLVQRWDELKGQIEQKTVNTIRAKGLKQVESSQSPEEHDPTHGLTPEELEAARLMGIDPKDYAAMKDEKYTID